jgi:hypothetical protein
MATKKPVKKSAKKSAPAKEKGSKKGSTALERAKARIAKMNEKGGKQRDYQFLDNNVEKQVVRIFGGKADPEDFHKEVLYHREIGKDRKMVACPTTFDDPCPICERMEELRQKAPLLAEYQRQQAPLWAEYERQKAPLLAEYERQEAPLWAEYERQEARSFTTLYLSAP